MVKTKSKALKENEISYNYLIKNKINNELDCIIIKWIELAKIYDGMKCNKCSIIQGSYYNGVPKYYCEHITKIIDKKLNKEKKEISNKIFNCFKKVTK